MLAAPSAAAAAAAVLMVVLVSTLGTLVVAQSTSTTTTTGSPAAPGCAYTEWSPFGACAVQSDECVRVRVRSVLAATNTPATTTNATSTAAPCTNTNHVESCDPQSCAEEWCSLGEWSEWSPCSVSCGDGGMQFRSRRINTIPNVTCPHLQGEELQQTQPCPVIECPTPEVVAENGDLYLTVPDGNAVYFKEGDIVTSLDTLRDEIAMAVDELGDHQSGQLDLVRQFAADEIGLLRTAINDKAAQTLRTAKAYTDVAAADLEFNITAAAERLDGRIDTVQGRFLRELALLEDLVAHNLTVIDDKHGDGHESQAALITDLLADLADVQEDVASLVMSKADAADVQSEHASIRQELNAAVGTLNNRIDAIMTGLLPSTIAKPTAAATRSAVTITWQAPPSALPIIGYTIFYTVADGDEQEAEVPGDTTTFELTNLESGQSCTLAVAATNGLGAAPQRSTAVTVATSGLVAARRYHCQPGAWEVTSSPSIKTACSVQIPISEPTIIHATFTGHAICGSAWIYGAISVNGDIPTPGSHQSEAPAHTYTRTWETFGTDRVVAVDSGTATVELRLRFGSSSCQFNGGSMHVVAITGRQAGEDEAFACAPSVWGTSTGTQQYDFKPCTTAIHAPFSSSLFSFFTGHVVTSGAVYGAVEVDNTPRGPDIGTQRYAPAHSYTSGSDWNTFRAFRTENIDAFDGDANTPLQQYGTALQPLGPAHSYSPQWETFQNARAVVLDAGQHTVSFAFRCVNSGSLNGAGLQGYFIRYDE
ncbi:hypothetical protein PTSG_05734 [Salpingoeca rosetta]|uniref:Fibronectin type-III domain-containing protein n=1 Tax=Salpingoeca rosetta (strain ATCC 50818 / BSB-021) TaxID=946362 RepID=F2UB27_SALR5|nr:uncharacterized protein PTSG_05734 [Salpingoeca rosetta]EGD74040.1 hypothetical protein PTSG_05734 [Salpingoeca rosetta]|eukprot:XP_004993602.1 hypothetical protein PTSG_05734 [Salpingoeca rosetta]